MGNIAGALESPRFTTLPRPSRSDAIYLPNCSSDAFITLLDLSPYNKKKKAHTKFLSLLLSPSDRGGGEGVRGERCRNAVCGCAPLRSGLCGAGWEAASSAGPWDGTLAPGRHPPPNWGLSAPQFNLNGKLHLSLSPLLLGLADPPEAHLTGQQGSGAVLGLVLRPEGCRGAAGCRDPSLGAAMCYCEVEDVLPLCLCGLGLSELPVALFSEKGAKPDWGHLCLGAAVSCGLGMVCLDQQVPATVASLS